MISLRENRENFTTKERLRRERDIILVRKKGIRLSLYPFVIYTLTNQINYPRIAIALTRSSGTSVVRNKTRRQLREFFRTHKAIFKNQDVFFFSNRPIKQPLNTQWFEKLSQILHSSPLVH